MRYLALLTTSVSADVADVSSSSPIKGLTGALLRLYGIVILVVLILFVILYIIKKRMEKNRGNEEITKKNKKLRRPSREIVDIEQVTDDGIIVFNNFRSFVAIMEVYGNNYYESSVLEQSIMEDSYTTLWHANQKPLQFTVQTHIHRLEPTVEKYDGEYDTLVEKHNLYTEELLLIEKSLSDIKRGAFNYPEGVVTEEQKRDYTHNLEIRFTFVKNEKFALEGLIVSNRGQFERIQNLTNNRQFPRRRQFYIARHNHNGNDFTDAQLTDHQIYERASAELRTNMNGLASSFIGAKCKYAVLHTKNSVLDVQRKHLRPRSGDMLHMKDLELSNMDDVVTTSTGRLEKQLRLQPEG